MQDHNQWPRNFATLERSGLPLPFTGPSLRRNRGSGSTHRTGQASAPLRRLAALQEPVFLVNSRSPQFSAASEGGRFPPPAAPLLPKVRGHFAEFAMRPSPKAFVDCPRPHLCRFRHGLVARRSFLDEGPFPRPYHSDRGTLPSPSRRTPSPRIPPSRDPERPCLPEQITCLRDPWGFGQEDSHFLFRYSLLHGHCPCSRPSPEGPRIA